MNYKQKMGYTAFGVVITLISMFFGAIISQPLVAQRNGGIDEIQCSKLTIVDKYGRPAIVLDITEESGNAIKIFNFEGNRGVQLSAGGGSHFEMSGSSGEEAFSVFATDLFTTMDINHGDKGTGIACRVFKGLSSSIEVNTPAGEKGLELLSSNRTSNILRIYDKAGTDRIYMPGEKGAIIIKDKEGDFAIDLESHHLFGNRVNVYDYESDSPEKARREKQFGKRFNVKTGFTKVKWSAP